MSLKHFFLSPFYHPKNGREQNKNFKKKTKFTIIASTIKITMNKRI